MEKDMSQTYPIATGENASTVIVGEPLARFAKAFPSIAPEGSRVAILADGAVASRLGAPLKKALGRAGYETHLLRIPPGEASKNLAHAGKLYRQLSKAGFERRSWLIALGGGVVGDLTGFVAATYLRGIPFVQIPTTLLAQVDASIGGKTAIDIPEGKNLVGSFYHPRWVWIDPSLLKTLPVAHWRNGLGEVIKYGAIADAKLFDRLDATIEKLVKGYSADWEPIIARCAEIKAAVVRKDPKERSGLRAQLNFGHSVGHAIEGAVGYKGYAHGEAISIGMFVAAKISQQLTGFDSVDRLRLETLLTRAGLPSEPYRPIPRARLMQFLSRDKKAEAGSVRFVLLERLGKAVSGKQVPAEILDGALSSVGL